MITCNWCEILRSEGESSRSFGRIILDTQAVLTLTGPFGQVL